MSSTCCTSHILLQIFIISRISLNIIMHLNLHNSLDLRPERQKKHHQYKPPDRIIQPHRCSPMPLPSSISHSLREKPLTVWLLLNIFPKAKSNNDFNPTRFSHPASDGVNFIGDENYYEPGEWCPCPSTHECSVVHVFLEIVYRLNLCYWFNDIIWKVMCSRGWKLRDMVAMR